MFVLRRTYDKLNRKLLQAKTDFAELQNEHYELIKEWNKVVRTINKNGGSHFLNGGTIRQEQQPQLTKQEIQRMLSLCHPDKHGGKQAATDITKRLIQLKHSCTA